MVVGRKSHRQSHHKECAWKGPFRQIKSGKITNQEYQQAGDIDRPFEGRHWEKPAHQVKTGKYQARKLLAQGRPVRVDPRGRKMIRGHISLK